MSFVFNYQAVLEARAAEEAASEQAIGPLVSRRNTLESELIEHRQYLESNRHLTRSQLVGDIDINVLRSYAGQSVQAMRRIRSLLLEMSELHGVMETAKEEWMECRRRRRSIECLRDRALVSWNRQRRRMEIREQDDPVSTRASRELQA